MGDINYQEISGTDALNTGRGKINKLLKNIENGDERFRKDYISDTSFEISTLVKEGNYLIGATVTSNPTKQLAMLIVFTTKMAIDNLALRVVQRIVGLSTGTELMRTINYSKSTNSVTSTTGWTAPSNTGKYQYNMLGTTDDLNSYVKDINLVANNPINAPAKGVFSVIVSSNYISKAASNQYFGTQLAVQTYPTNGTSVYLRNFKAAPTNATLNEFGDWVKLDTGARLAGKEIAYMGDSTVEHGNMPEVVQKRTGATVHKIGFGGSCLSFHNNADYDAFSGTSLADAIVSLDYSRQETANANLSSSDNNISQLNALKAINWLNIEYLIVQFGANDYNVTATRLGLETDQTRDTFYGAINYFIKTIQTKYPQIQIVFIAPHYRKNSDMSDTWATPNSSGFYLYEYVDALKKIAEKKGIPCLDMLRESGINEYNFSRFIADAVHPTILGYDFLGNKVASFIESNY